MGAVLDMGLPVLTLIPLTTKLVEFYGGIGFVSYAERLGERRMMMPARTALNCLSGRGWDRPPGLPPAAPR